MRKIEVTFNAGDKNPSIADALKPLLGEDWVVLQSDKVAFYVSNKEEYNAAMLKSIPYAVTSIFSASTRTFIRARYLPKRYASDTRFALGTTPLSLPTVSTISR